MNSTTTQVDSRSSLLKRWGGFIAGILGLTGLVWYISLHSEEFYRFQQLSFGGVALLSLFVLLGHGFMALKLQLGAALFGAKLSLWESFLLVQSGSFLNIIPLHVGTGLRALYLKRVHRLKFVEFGLVSVGTLLNSLFAAGVVGMVSLVYLRATNRVLYLIFSLYILAPLGVVLLVWLLKRGALGSRSLALIRQESKLGRLFKSVGSSLEIIFKQPRIIFYWFVLDLLTNLVLGVRFWLEARHLEYPFNFAAAVVLQGISRISAIVSIIPSGTIGLREALTGMGSTGLDEAAVFGVMIATLDRVIVTAWIVVLGTIALFILKNRLLRAESTDSDLDVKELST